MLRIVAIIGDRYLVADLVRGNFIAQVRHAVDLFAIDLQNDIASLEACLSARSIKCQSENVNALVNIKLIAIACSRRRVKDGNAEIRTCHISLFNQLINNGLHRIDWDGKAHPLNSGCCYLGTVNADDFTVGIHKSPTRITRTDRRIGLKQLYTLVADIKCTIQCTDDPYRDAALELQPQRISDGNGGFADYHRI